MASAVGSLVRRALRRPEKPLNVLLYRHGDPLDATVAQCGHHVLWTALNDGVAPPPGAVCMRGGRMPPEFDVDVVVAPPDTPEWESARAMAQLLHVPLVAVPPGLAGLPAAVKAFLEAQ
jgi:hypothetical protein